ncbi:MAG: FtsW/RodA/SpoVE family cell cycle protein, partial [Chloroflexaceae bacterium]|nr:FtsW/RodA/SpoVE family cell cycle protein [Chloroflexaceae bacterium]
MDGRIWREYNFFLLGCVLILLSISLISVYSATLNAVTAFGTPLSILFPRHMINILVGLIGMVVVTLFDYRLLSSLTLPLYLLTIGVLALVHLLGTISEGAQSWIALGTRTFQPSEFAKIALIMVLAAYWSHFEETRNHWLT